MAVEVISSDLAYDLLTIMGPTASGKTSLAVAVALRLGTEIISADSRQVYRRMDIGTGKDLAEYTRGECSVPYHLIDIAEPGERYNIYRYQHDFLTTYADVHSRHLTPIVCGGSGLYLEAVLRGYRLHEVPENAELRRSLAGKTLAELTQMLSTYKQLHNTTDVDTAQRAIRAIEIEEYYATLPAEARSFPALTSINVCLVPDRDKRRERITRRLRERLDAGMADEVRQLLSDGLTPEQLMYYGLEYKYITLYVMGELSRDEMFRQLEIAIHQFAKRQMTWFRGMERRGVLLHYIDAELPEEDKADMIINIAINASS